jgi:hypothetical protein
MQRLKPEIINTLPQQYLRLRIMRIHPRAAESARRWHAYQVTTPSRRIVERLERNLGKWLRL